jgi:hypothetical protein
VFEGERREKQIKQQQTKPGKETQKREKIIKKTQPTWFQHDFHNYKKKISHTMSTKINQN